MPAHSTSVPAASIGCGAPPTDGRATLEELSGRFESLSSSHGWLAATVYAKPDDRDLSLRAWRTVHGGEAPWIRAGIHDEEPAGPNAIASNLAGIVELA